MLREFGEVFVGMEHFGSSAQPSMKTCLQRLEEADCVIALLGTRYGSRADDGKSFTQREIEHAHARGIPVLGYVLDETRYRVLPADVDGGKDREDLVALQRWMRSVYTLAEFASPEDLAVKVSRDLARLRDAKPQSAFDEIRVRIGQGAALPLDFFAMSAHNLDIIHQVDRVAPDHEVQIERVEGCPGGSGANTAHGLARLGCRVAVAGVIARDAAGRTLKESLRSQDVDCSLLLEVGGAGETGTALIFADTKGVRSIYVRPGVNDAFATEVKRGRAASRLVGKAASARVAHFSSFVGAKERALQESVIASLPARAVVSLAPGALYAKLGLDRLKKILARTNLLFLYEQQLDALLDRSSPSSVGQKSIRSKLEALFEWKKENRLLEPLMVVVKSAEGVSNPRSAYFHLACGRTSIEIHLVPETPPEPSVFRRLKDGTGAGDALAAGVVFGLLRGLPLPACADVGYVASLLTSMKLGARASFPQKEALVRHHQKWFPASGTEAPLLSGLRRARRVRPRSTVPRTPARASAGTRPLPPRGPSS